MQRKLKKVLVVVLGLCLLVSGCSKGATKKVATHEKKTETAATKKVEKPRKVDLAQVKFDMTKAALIETIGEPKEIVTDTAQIETEMKKEMKNLMLVGLKNKDRIVDFFGGEEKLSALQERLTDVSKLVMYQYGDKQNVYVYEDKVVFRSF